jgi:malonyl-CoA O-methyltransferase
VQNKSEYQSKAVKGFSRFAHVYNRYNMIQTEAAKTLVASLKARHYSTVIDVGCGRGAIIDNFKTQNITFDQFIALDLSEEMLSLHPSGENIIKVHTDFSHPDRLKHYCKDREALVISSSALQWSKALDKTLSTLAKCGSDAHFAIFTSNTFRTLHQIAGIESPIYSEDFLKESISKYYHADFSTKAYRLEFKDTREMFRYIQKSGVGGGERELGYREMKRVMEEYPLNYLEFEVLFVEATPL